MTLDRDAVQVLDLIEQTNRPSPQSLPLADARALYQSSCSALGGPVPDLFEVRDLQAPLQGGHDIRLRLYRARDARDLDVCVFYHGGGWVLGDLDTHDTLCRHLALATGGNVVAVDYRLAPEHPFPAAFEDAYDALAWIYENAPGLGGNADRISVVGDSAGGNLAAAVALAMRESEQVSLTAQCLIYPATDFSRDWPSYSQRADQKPLTFATMDWFGNCYMPAGTDRADWRGSPLQAADHEGLPPALIVTAGYDVLRDEGRAYADALADAQVEVEHMHLPGQIHGFMTMSAMMRDADIVTQKIAQFIAQYT